MSKKVLIVDDSLPLHKLVKAYLKPDSLAVHSAYDGESGLASAVQLLPNLIILDVDMPRVDGFEVCRRLKVNPATGGIPVVFLTASSRLDNRVKGLDIGASDYISKPFKPEELRARVRALLRARSQMESLSLVDGVTGLWNRLYLSEHLDAHVSLAKRFGTALSRVVLAVDPGEAQFEAPAAPATAGVLRTIAQVLSGRCRTEDVVCRLDAWEFAILVTRADCSAAAIVAQRLRDEVQRQVQSRSGREVRITCSVEEPGAPAADAPALHDRIDAAGCGSRCAGFNNLFFTDKTAEAVRAVA